ncbi:hypothetical protein L3Q72_04805 [Vibrio sp. JC009]|uniref:hypothetical protein n=1 Tax=Vibrio sp. JC009 TaxID=2912314 RepID=UPI0023AFA66D|nr:hypothetical protein [Vibrio sp. JC009]WED23338.1 hypothetical protein L3Q72_04805 [Vibrio sp. JC009]
MAEDTLQRKKVMVESPNYLMAIDLLCCHLGMTEQEAMEQLGIDPAKNIHETIAETQQALLGSGEK